MTPMNRDVVASLVRELPPGRLRGRYLAASVMAESDWNSAFLSLMEAQVKLTLLEKGAFEEDVDEDFSQIGELQAMIAHLKDALLKTQNRR